MHARQKMIVWAMAAGKDSGFDGRKSRIDNGQLTIVTTRSTKRVVTW